MRFLLWMALLLPLGLASAGEGRVTGSDLAEIRGVINRQIEAFRRDDARGAFALVSPEVQHSFGTPERFLDVVRISYRAVYRPANVSFLDLVVMGGEVVQQVRQHDGSWRTNGCHLVQPARTISA